MVFCFVQSPHFLQRLRKELNRWCFARPSGSSCVNPFFANSEVASLSFSAIAPSQSVQYDLVPMPCQVAGTTHSSKSICRTRDMPESAGEGGPNLFSWEKSAIRPCVLSVPNTILIPYRLVSSARMVSQCPEGTPVNTSIGERCTCVLLTATPRAMKRGRNS